jgi:hypothetical protein
MPKEQTDGKEEWLQNFSRRRVRYVIDETNIEEIRLRNRIQRALDALDRITEGH